MALTKLNAQRPRRREATRRNKALACWPPRHNSRVARRARISRAMATKANKRDHAVICLMRAWAKPNHHFASRTPASQPGRWAYSATACAAVSGRLATSYQSPHVPCLSRCRLIVTHSG